MNQHNADLIRRTRHLIEESRHLVAETQKCINNTRAHLQASQKLLAMHKVDAHLPFEELWPKKF